MGFQVYIQFTENPRNPLNGCQARQNVGITEEALAKADAQALPQAL